MEVHNLAEFVKNSSFEHLSEEAVDQLKIRLLDSVGTAIGVVERPPACATTLIISLGILPYWYDGLIILIAVVILYFTCWIYREITFKKGFI